MKPNATGLFSTSAFQGKIFGVTGAASGIGKAMTDLYTHMGATVLMMDMDADRLADVESDFKDAGKKVHAIAADVSKQADLKRAIDLIRDQWGVLHGWVNNAGINLSGLNAEQDESEFLACWEVNTLAAWRSLKLSQDLFPATGGAIVNISSILAWRTRPANMAYASSKAGLEGLTRAMAIELAPRNIRVNCIIPGNIRVQPWEEELRSHDVAYPEHVYLNAKVFTLMGHLVQPIRPNGGPEDIANLGAFLLSDACSFLSGESIIVDGALHVEMKTITEHTSQEIREKILPVVELREKRDQLRDEAIARGELRSPERVGRLRRKKS